MVASEGNNTLMAGKEHEEGRMPIEDPAKEKDCSEVRQSTEMDVILWDELGKVNSPLKRD